MGAGGDIETGFVIAKPPTHHATGNAVSCSFCLSCYYFCLKLFFLFTFCFCFGRWFFDPVHGREACFGHCVDAAACVGTVQCLAASIKERPRAPSGVAAFMPANSKTPYITPSMDFSSCTRVVRGRRGQQLDDALPWVLCNTRYGKLCWLSPPCHPPPPVST